MIDRIVDILIALHICEEVPDVELRELPAERGHFPTAAFTECA